MADGLVEELTEEELQVSQEVCKVCQEIILDSLGIPIDLCGKRFCEDAEDLYSAIKEDSGGS